MNKKEIKAFACEAANGYLSKNHVKKWGGFK